MAAAIHVNSERRQDKPKDEGIAKDGSQFKENVRLWLEAGDDEDKWKRSKFPHSQQEGSWLLQYTSILNEENVRLWLEAGDDEDKWKRSKFPHSQQEGSWLLQYTSILNDVAKHLESANTMFSFIWWIIWVLLGNCWWPNYDS